MAEKLEIKQIWIDEARKIIENNSGLSDLTLFSIKDINIPLCDDSMAVRFIKIKKPPFVKYPKRPISKQIKMYRLILLNKKAKEGSKE